MPWHTSSVQTVALRLALLGRPPPRLSMSAMDAEHDDARNFKRPRRSSSEDSEYCFSSELEDAGPPPLPLPLAGKAGIGHAPAPHIVWGAVSTQPRFSSCHPHRAMVMQPPPPPVAMVMQLAVGHALNRLFTPTDAPSTPPELPPLPSKETVQTMFEFLRIVPLCPPPPPPAVPALPHLHPNFHAAPHIPTRSLFKSIGGPPKEATELLPPKVSLGYDCSTLS